MHLWLIPRLYGIPKLESELENRSMLESKGSSSRHAMDQRNRNSTVNWRPHHTTMDFGRNPISQIMMSWMRWWRLHWESFTIGTLTSERKSVSKSSVLRTTTDVWEEDKLPPWSVTIFVQRDLMMEFKVYQIRPAPDYTTTIFMIWIFAGNKQFHLQVIHQPTTFWNVCTRQNCRIHLRFKQYCHCTIKTLFGVEENLPVTVWECV